MNTRQRCHQSGAVAVVGGRDMAARQVWRPGRIAYQKALLHAELGQSTSHSPASPTGRARHCDGCLGGDHGRPTTGGSVLSRNSWSQTSGASSTSLSP